MTDTIDAAGRANGKQVWSEKPLCKHSMPSICSIPHWRRLLAGLCSAGPIWGPATCLTQMDGTGAGRRGRHDQAPRLVLLIVFTPACVLDVLKRGRGGQRLSECAVLGRC